MKSCTCSGAAKSLHCQLCVVVIYHRAGHAQSFLHFTGAFPIACPETTGAAVSYAVLHKFLYRQGQAQGCACVCSKLWRTRSCATVPSLSSPISRIW